MKKAVIFILGLIIGVIVCFAVTSADNSAKTQQTTTETTTQATAEETVDPYNIEYSYQDYYLDEEVKNKIYALPLEVLPDIIYGKINEDGKGVAVVGGGEGMQSCYVAFLKTTDGGQTWKVIEDRKNIHAGEPIFVFLEERLIMLNYDYIYCGTSINISDDYGKTWKVIKPAELLASSDIEIPENCAEEYMYLKSVILDVDETEKSFILAFLSEDDRSVVHIAKYNMDAEITEEYYVNKKELVRALTELSADESDY